MRIGIFGAVAGMAVAAAGMAAAQEACGAFPAEGAAHVCTCAAGAATGSVWGSGPYTADSSLCAAAVHAGVIGAGGGVVVALRVPGQAAYPGSAANGITSSSWGAYGTSFAFAGTAAAALAGGGAAPAPAAPAAGSAAACAAFPRGAARHECACPAGGAVRSVWGSGPYTADSDLCTAARHAGVIGAEGGPIAAMTMPGLAGYRGSAANGVQTSDWGGYGESFTFDANLR